MPELPEVETVRRGLERLVVGRTILSLEVKVPKMIKTSYDSFLTDLPGQTIQALRRRGKYLIFDFGQLIMISHLRMEENTCCLQIKFLPTSIFTYFFFFLMAPPSSIKMSASLEPLIYWLKVKRRLILQRKSLVLSLLRRLLNMLRLREP